MTGDKLELRDMTIAELLARWPQTTNVFQRHNMGCVGCVLAPFYTIREAAKVYSLPPEEFIIELVTQIEGEDAAEK